MTILNDRARGQARDALSGLTGPVRLVFFETTLDCDTCPEAKSLAQEVAALSDKIRFEAYNVHLDKEKAREFRVNGAPVLAVVGEKDHGIRFYGTPGGYEFGTLIEAIQDVSAGRVALPPEIVEGLKALRSPVHLRVFVTPT
jgi:alkyl hydroperoxide reductase subunit AhpF